MKQNLHTHCRFCDGKDTIEDLVRTAIDKGFDSLGFSSHGLPIRWTPVLWMMNGKPPTSIP